MPDEEKKSFWSNLTNVVSGSIALMSQRLDESLVKSAGKPPPQGIRLAMELDPQLEAMSTGYVDRPTMIPPEALKKMAEKNVIVAALIALRCNQVAMFSRPSPNKYTTGFRISLLNEELNGDEQVEEIRQMLEKFVLNTGRIAEERPLEVKNSFDNFLRLTVKDIMIHDAVAIERIHDNGGSLFCFISTPAENIRYAVKNNAENIISNISSNAITEEESDRVERNVDKLMQIDPKEICYVQVYQNKTVAAFTKNDLWYQAFNPTNDLASPYTVPPLEKLISVVTSQLYAQTHNANFFTQAGAQRGIFVFKGDIPDAQLDAFRRQYYTQVATAKNSYRTPFVSIPPEGDLQFLPVQPNNRDMEWGMWMSYLVKSICAVYLVDPAEIGWASEAAGALFDSSGTKVEKQTEASRDKGLRPILRFIESFMNDIVIREINPKLADLFKFEFVGVDQDDEEAEILKRVEALNYMTINEVRAKDDLPAIPIPIADLPPQLIAAFMQSQQMAMMAEQGQDQSGQEDKKGPPDKEEKEDRGDDEDTEKSIKVEYYRLEK